MPVALPTRESRPGAGTTATAIIALLLLLLAATVAAPLHAQDHPGGIVLGGGYPNQSAQFLSGSYVVDKTMAGRFTTIWTLQSPATYRPSSWVAAAMDVDNQCYVHTTGQGISGYTHTTGVFRFDPQTAAVTTIAYNSVDFSIGLGLAVGQDGDYFIASSAVQALDYRIYRAPGDGSYSTVLSTNQLNGENFTFAIHRDVGSGELLVPTSGGNGALRSPVFRVSDLGTVSTWHASTKGPVPGQGWDQEIATGDMLFCMTNKLYRSTAGNAPTTVVLDLNTVLPGGRFADGGVFENQSKGNPQFIVNAYSQSPLVGYGNRLMWLDGTNNWTITKTVDPVYSTSATQIIFPLGRPFHDRANYVQTIRRTNTRWDIDLNLPAHPGAPYVIAASLSGCRPGFGIDTRRVWLNPDPVLFATLRRELPGIFGQGPRVLDVRGSAAGYVDIGPLGLPRGIQATLHIGAAVLDPNAPNGLAFITEPVPLVVRT